jgi:hypothetical protein
MVRRHDVHPVHGSFGFRLLPGYVYTFTTVARHGKGSARSPRPRRFGSYVEGRHVNPLDGTPMYLTAMDGAFEHRPCVTDPARTCIQQTATQHPVYWKRHNGFPYAVIGDRSLRDYTVSSDVLFTRPGSSAGVLARFSHRGRSSRAAHFRGYIFTLRDSAAWELLKIDPVAGISVLRSGKLKRRPGLLSWHKVSLTARGSVLIARVDRRRVGSVGDGDRRYARGTAGIAAGTRHAGGEWTGTSWPAVQYRGLTIAPST